ALRAKIRSRRPDHRRPLRLPPAGRRILSVARRLGAGRRRSGGAAAVARGGAARGNGALSRRAPSRMLQTPARAPFASPRRGPGYIRVAMVQDQDTTAQALHRLVAVLG